MKSIYILCIRRPQWSLQSHTNSFKPCSDWEVEYERTGGTVENVEVWLRRNVHSMPLDINDPNESDTVLLSNPPSLSCKRYARMRAYGNHWRVEDDISKGMDSFDSGVACFEANEQSSGSGKDYVGILQDILVPDYGGLNTPVILFSCLWKKRTDNHNNNTYIRDADGFLTVNFRHNLSRSVDPYVFPEQCTQVFFSDDDLRPPGSQWKVVLRKEARGRRKVEENDDIFITTNSASEGRGDPGTSFLSRSEEPNLTGAIVLDDTENAIALQGLDDQAGRRKRKRAVRQG